MDREKVIKAFKERISSCSMIGDGFDVTINWKLADDILSLLKEQEVVRHGEWITIWREDDPDTSSHARCSVCNRVSERPTGEYCKWCGVKMDLEGR